MSEEINKKLKIAYEKAGFYTRKFVMETTSIEARNNCPKGPHIIIFLKNETVAKLPSDFDGFPVEYIIEQGL